MSNRQARRASLQPYDLTLTENPDDRGKLLAHRPDCRYARRLADQGEPVITMLGCTGPFPENIPKHSCLQHQKAKHNGA